ncbi:COG1470 family protein [Streptomyces smyrnaeus]|uniref:COG1470 family protein n=1 Tax=Streptomyces smyrnaeus TaxID=1387713 RepID=UPI0033E24AD6
MVGRRPPRHGARTAPAPRTPAPRPGRTRGALVCVLVALCVSTAGSPARAAPLRDDPTWSAAPAPPAGTPGPDARSYFYLEGEPGTVLRDSVALTNPGDESRTFRLRGADAYNERGGGFAVREEGRSRGPGKWIATAEDTVEVPPRTRAEVPLSVTLPDSAVPGDHPAALVVDDGERKVGVRMYLRVSGPTLAALSIENVSVEERDDGSAAIGYTLVNRGNTTLRPRLAVDADGLFGSLIRQPARALPVELLPGRSVTRHERWPKPPSVDVAHIRLTVTAEAGARATATTTYPAVPVGWLVGVLLVLAGGAVGWYARRRRAGGRADRTPSPPAPPERHERRPRPQPAAPTTGAAK